MAAYNEGHYADAANHLTSALNLEPNSVEINFYLGVCRLLSGSNPDAISLLKHVINTSDSEYSQRAHYYLAKAYLHTSRNREAAVELGQTVVGDDPLSRHAYYLSARLREEEELREHRPPDLGKVSPKASTNSQESTDK